MDKELAIVVEERNDVYLLQLSGDITKTSGEKLLKLNSWEKGLPDGRSILVINFSNVNYINSAGIAYLIRMSKVLYEQNVTIRGFGLEYHYEKMFNIVGLTKYLKFYPSEWAAIENL